MAASGAGDSSNREFDSIEAELSALLGAAAATDEPEDTHNTATRQREEPPHSLEGFDENLFANALALALNEAQEKDDEPQSSSNNASNHGASGGGGAFDEEGLAQLEILNNLLSGNVESASVSEDHGDIWSKISQVTSDSNISSTASTKTPSGGNKASAAKPARPKAKSRAKSRPKVSKYANVGDPTFALSTRPIQPPPPRHRFPTLSGAEALSGSIMGTHKATSKPRQPPSTHSAPNKAPMPASTAVNAPRTTTVSKSSPIFATVPSSTTPSTTSSSSTSSSTSKAPEEGEYDLHTALSKFLDSADADMSKLGVSASTGGDPSSFEQQTAALLQGFLENSEFDFGDAASSGNSLTTNGSKPAAKSDFSNLSSTFGALSEASNSTPKNKPKKTAAAKGKATKTKPTPRITAANASPANNPLLQELRAQQNRANQSGGAGYSSQPLSARYATVPGVRHPPLPVPAPLPPKAGQKPKRAKSTTTRAKVKAKSVESPTPVASPSPLLTASPTPLPSNNQASALPSALTATVPLSPGSSSTSFSGRPKTPTPPATRPSSQSLIHDQSNSQNRVPAPVTPKSAPATPITPVAKPQATMQQSYSIKSGTSSYLQDSPIATGSANLGQSGSISKPTTPSQQQMRAYTAQPPPPSTQFAYTSSFSIQEKLSKPASFSPSNRSSAIQARPKTATPPQLPSQEPQQQKPQQRPHQPSERLESGTVKRQPESVKNSTPSPAPSTSAPSTKPTITTTAGPDASVKPVSMAPSASRSTSTTPTLPQPVKAVTATSTTATSKTAPIITSPKPTPTTTMATGNNSNTTPSISTVKRPATVSVSTSPRPVVVPTFRGRSTVKSKAPMKGPTLSIAETLALTRSNMQKTKDAAPKIDPMLNRKPVFQGSSYSPRSGAEPYRAPTNNFIFSTVKSTATPPRPLGVSQHSQSTPDVEDDPSLVAAMQLVKEAFGSAAQESEKNDELSAETMDALQEALQALGKQFEEESKGGASQTKASRVLARVRRFRSINMNTPEERERIRMENRERKKRWRTFNADRNKDNDLRVRVHKRAHKLFGTEPSERKTEWIEAEIKKRRARRIQKEKTTERYQLNQNANPAAAAAANSAATVQAASTARAAVAAVAPLTSQPILSTVRPGPAEEEEDEAKDDVRILLENLTRNDVDISGALSILAKDSTLLKNISEIFGDENGAESSNGASRRSASEAFGEDAMRMANANKRSQPAKGSITFRVQSYTPSLPVVSPAQQSALPAHAAPSPGRSASPVEVSAPSPMPTPGSSKDASDEEDPEINELAGLLSQAVEVLNTETSSTELSVLAGIPPRPPAFRAASTAATVQLGSITNDALSATKSRHTPAIRSYVPPISSGGGVAKRAATTSMSTPLSTVREKLATIPANSPLSFPSPKPPQYYMPKKPITIAPPYASRRVSDEKRVKSLGFPPALTGLAQALKR